MKTLLAAVLAALVLAGAGASAPLLVLPLDVTVSPTNGDIAWVDGSTSQVWVANADGSDLHRLGTPFADGVGQLTWTHEGLLVDSNFTLSLLTQTGKRVKIGVVGDSTFSVGGERAASGSAGCGYCHGAVTVYNVRTHTAVRVGNPKQSNVEATLSADGAKVAYTRSNCGPPSGECGNNPALVVTTIKTRATRQLATSGYCAEWSPDGRTIAFFDLNALESVSSTGGTPRMLLRHAVCNSAALPAWSPDSQSLAVRANNRLTVIDVATRQVRTSAKSLGTLASFTWSPDGTSLVAAFRNDSACGDVDRLAVGDLAPQPVFRGCP